MKHADLQVGMKVRLNRDFCCLDKGDDDFRTKGTEGVIKDFYCFDDTVEDEYKYGKVILIDGFQTYYDRIDACENRNVAVEKADVQVFSKRDTFAAMAMQGILANTDTTYQANRKMVHTQTEEEKTVAEIVSVNAVAYADALIAELAKETVK